MGRTGMNLLLAAWSCNERLSKNTHINIYAIVVISQTKNRRTSHRVVFSVLPRSKQVPSPGVLIFLCLKVPAPAAGIDDDAGPPPPLCCCCCCPGVFEFVGDGAVDAQWTNSYKERVL